MRREGKQEDNVATWEETKMKEEMAGHWEKNKEG